MDLRPEHKLVLREAIETFGKVHQIGKLFEEIAELEEAIIKNHFGRDSAEHIAEEIADVEIMLYQAKLIYGNERMANDYVEKKIARLSETIERERVKDG